MLKLILYRYNLYWLEYLTEITFLKKFWSGNLTTCNQILKSILWEKYFTLFVKSLNSALLPEATFLGSFITHKLKFWAYDKIHFISLERMTSTGTILLIFKVGLCLLPSITNVCVSANSTQWEGLPEGYTPTGANC